MNCKFLCEVSVVDNIDAVNLILRRHVANMCTWMIVLNNICYYYLFYHSRIKR